MAKDKVAKYGVEPKPKKKVVVSEPLYEDGHPLAWRFSRCDINGPFAWNVQPAEKFREVLHKLFELESKSWTEIKNTGSHPIPVAKLCKEARDRLVQIEQDDLDALVSFRITGPNRVWCVKNGHIMRPLWWDENHQVYPTEKDPADRRKRKRREGKG